MSKSERKRQFEIELSAAHEDDFELIYDYLTENRSFKDAAAFLDTFSDTIDALEHLPLRGGVPKELDALGIRDYL